jgi:hypothetical protein
MLSNTHLKDVCLLYNCGQQCRYLDEDHLSWSWHCLKHNTTKKAEIDARIKQMLEDCSKKGIDPHDQGIACGDNCPGYPKLKYKQQGYDLD